ncbi:MAG: hypothetical protein HZC51_09135 [Nitrospirae bacterium]|nr:hypothetical protein [Nitrospirota bacterium]
MKKLLVILPFLIVLPILYAFCGFGPWKGRVVDAETKKPIEGAVVVAVFDKGSIGLGEYVEQFHDAIETVTDKDGYWEMPRYHVIPVPFFREFRSPAFTIFKPGYGSYPHDQVSPRYSPGFSARDFFLKDGAVVELPRWTDYKKRLDTLHTTENLSNAPPGRLPMFEELIANENKNLGINTEDLR